jgi:hypothetical protein
MNEYWYVCKMAVVTQFLAWEEEDVKKRESMLARPAKGENNFGGVKKD